METVSPYLKINEEDKEKIDLMESGDEIFIKDISAPQFRYFYPQKQFKSRSSIRGFKSGTIVSKG